MPALYFLITTKDRYNSEPATFAIAQHPAEYMANHLKASLIFAMPLTKEQFDAYKKAYSGD